MSSDNCEECHIGRCKPVSLTYMRKIGRHMVILPDAPARQCDMCGDSRFDSGFLLTMQVLLERLTDNRNRSGRKKQPVADRQQEWTPVRRGG